MRGHDVYDPTLSQAYQEVFYRYANPNTKLIVSPEEAATNMGWYIAGLHVVEVEEAHMRDDQAREEARSMGGEAGLLTLGRRDYVWTTVPMQEVLGRINDRIRDNFTAEGMSVREYMEWFFRTLEEAPTNDAQRQAVQSIEGMGLSTWVRTIIGLDGDTFEPLDRDVIGYLLIHAERGILRDRRDRLSISPADSSAGGSPDTISEFF